TRGPSAGPDRDCPGCDYSPDASSDSSLTGRRAGAPAAFRRACLPGDAEFRRYLPTRPLMRFLREGRICCRSGQLLRFGPHTAQIELARAQCRQSVHLMQILALGYPQLGKIGLREAAPEIGRRNVVSRIKRDQTFAALLVRNPRYGADVLTEDRVDRFFD